MTDSTTSESFKDQFTYQSRSGNLPQIYTVAQAVRPVRFPISQKLSGNWTSHKSKLETCTPLIENQPSKNDASVLLQETLQIKRKLTTQKQPRSTLPMKMIVSRKATRNRDIEEPQGDNSLDLSECRYHKLTPPSWQNRNNSTKRRRPTQTENIIEEMKKRCVGINTHTNTIVTGNSDSLDLESLLYSQGNKENILLNTPRNEHAFNQLYGRKQTRVDRRSPSLPFDQEELSQWNRPAANHDYLKETEKPEEKFVFNPILTPTTPSEPEFIWNPVILKPKTRYLSNLLFETRNETLDFQSGNQIADNVCSLNFPSPVTPASSSSGLTVEEESVRCTLFAKKDSNVFLKSDYQSSILMPRLFRPDSPTFGDRRTVMNFLKHPKLYRFYEE